MNSQPPSALDMRLYAGVQLTRPLLRHITAAVEAGLKTAGISVGMRAVLEALLDGEASLPELTGALALKRQFIHRMLHEAQQSDLVSSRPHPTRKNGFLYRLTPAGSSCIETVRGAELERMRMFLSQQRPEDVQAFLRVQASLNQFFQTLAGGETWNSHDGANS